MFLDALALFIGLALLFGLAPDDPTGSRTMRPGVSCHVIPILT
jgi:hypothetical protein